MEERGSDRIRIKVPYGYFWLDAGPGIVAYTDGTHTHGDILFVRIDPELMMKIENISYWIDEQKRKIGRENNV